MDVAAKKTLLRKLPYGLFVLTARHGERLGMMTVNFVTQCAFDPPMLAVAMEEASATRGIVDETGFYVLNLLGEEQRELAGKLGRHSARDPGKLDGVEWVPAAVTAAPVLAGVVGWLECRVRGRVPAGDHQVYVAEVVEAALGTDGALLQMAAAGYRHFG